MGAGFFKPSTSASARPPGRPGQLYELRSSLKLVLTADYRFGSLNAVIFIACAVLGAVAQALVGGLTPRGVVALAAVTVSLIGLLRFVPLWESVIVSTSVGCLATYLVVRPDGYGFLLASLIVAGLLAPCCQIAKEWERAVVLRLGKFRALRGPGYFAIIPIIDSTPNYVDQRIRVTDFSAETTLTKDTVPVNVDAIAFWMVWDAQKSVLEVEAYEDAVILSAQTALRDAIGKHELGELLSERHKLGEEIQTVLERKTSPWGITAESIEIRDIMIPDELQDAMSRQAQAERERQSRIILGTAETEIAQKFVEAAKQYEGNPVAVHLRAMNMVFEGLKQKQGSMVIVPSTAVETMGLGALGGLTALARQGGGTAKGAGSPAQAAGH